MASATRNGATVPDQINVPADVLARHGFRLLDPTSAVRDSDGERPLTTAYRPDTLLVQKSEVGSLVPDKDNDYDKALADLGLVLRVPDGKDWQESIGRLHDDVGVPARLERTDPKDADRPPDAWTALVALRKWFANQENLAAAGRDKPPVIGLDHLMIAAAGTAGTPYTGGGSVSGAGGLTLHTGDRNPVHVVMAKPPRAALADLPGGRRPVIAVLDTGIGKHPWLPISGDPAADVEVEVAQDFQDEIAAHEQHLVDTGGASIVPLADPMEVRDEVQPLLGLTDSHSGHGTFVAGLVMQTCPDAKVLSLRMLHSDGYSTEGAFLVALDWLHRRVIAAKADDTLRIDVVSLSLGFYPETADPAKVPLVKAAIDRLTAEGVVVVAAAGNDTTTRTFLPAAFGLDNPLVAAVGALNAPGDTIAAFGNAGRWISRWAPGNALVSTVPIWEGARGPEVAPEHAAIDPVARTSPDGDNLRSGFATWAGTSFATPVVAGKIGSVIVENQTALAAMDAEKRALTLLEMTDDKLKELNWPVRPVATQ